VKENTETLDAKLELLVNRCKLKRPEKSSAKKFKKNVAVSVIKEKQKHKRLKKQINKSEKKNKYIKIN
jgi:hypothetical protein